MRTRTCGDGSSFVIHHAMMSCESLGRSPKVTGWRSIEVTGTGNAVLSSVGEASEQHHPRRRRAGGGRRGRLAERLALGEQSLELVAEVAEVVGIGVGSEEFVDHGCEVGERADGGERGSVRRP